MSSRSINDCPICKGTGKSFSDECAKPILVTCRDCHGTGRKPLELIRRERLLAKQVRDRIRYFGGEIQ